MDYNDLKTTNEPPGTLLPSRIIPLLQLFVLVYTDLVVTCFYCGYRGHWKP